MPRTAPITLATREVAYHQVRGAWGALGGSAPARVERVREETRSKPAMYRLVFTPERRPAVYVKRSRNSDLALERTVYQEVLPRLPLSVPRYLGSHRDEEGATWMFVEDVGDREISRTRRDHRVLASRWLGRLHRSAAGDAVASRLPDGGPARYLGHLQTGRETIRRYFGNFALAADDRSVLTGLLGQLDRLETRWAVVEGSCTGLPHTLVHGDFRRKNVRIRSLGDTTVLYVLDWEMAGWGVPAADLVGAFVDGAIVRIDPGAYLETVRDQWPDLEAAALRRLSIVGRLFQALAGTAWASVSLRFETQRHLERPVSQMQVYHDDIATALRLGEETLGWA